MGTIVDKLYGEYSAIVSMMDQYNAVSFRNTLNENFSKNHAAVRSKPLRISDYIGGIPFVPKLQEAIP